MLTTKTKERRKMSMPIGIDQLTVSPSRYFDSKIAIAAREPEPIVANGSVSVDP